MILGLNWPEPQSSAAGSRMLQLIGLFQEKNWTITFMSPASRTDYSVDLEGKGIHCVQIFPNTEKANRLIGSANPDIVLFDRFMVEEQFGWRVTEVCPLALQILDTEDLHFLRKARQQAVKKNRNPESADLYSETAKRELASILRCDLSLIISRAEMDLLTHRFNLNPDILFYLPLLPSPSWLSNFWGLPDFAERQRFMFVGNFRHPPNYDAVLWLKTAIWPLIRKRLPHAELKIYGAYTPQKVQQLHAKKEGFLVKGRTESLGSTLRSHRILLSPLRFGAGLKGKILDAMQNGTPVVTTSIGAEGINGDLPFNGKIEDVPDGIAKASVELYRDEGLWQKAQLKGHKILKDRFDKSQFDTLFINKLRILMENLESHRRSHFISAILNHHRQQSTKYMARWIETKHKLNLECPGPP